MTPFHLGTKQPWALGGPDPLDGISIYAHGGPVPHWHYVGYGMSELYEKESEDPAVSGWGFEFTVRLLRRPDEAQPPMWPAQLMQKLGRYVFDSGKWFEPGHTMKASGPLATDRPDSAIRAMAFTVDPELGEIDTPHGELRFLQIVGLTMKEYQAALGGNTAAVLDHLARYLPLYVTDVDREALIRL
ncbi:suppressor of fused domain protein [Nocardia uniformis]|uniref:Suppressor of fused domain protein n=2 Tax=Nocardia uniformis TaxID=53432 RepID=A0A849BWC6_9NOCA|nr:suppressor of fused domain protein [Nocardia uniformis]